MRLLKVQTSLYCCLFLVTALLGAQVGARGLHSHSRNLAKRYANDSLTMKMLNMLYSVLHGEAAKQLMWTISGSIQGHEDGCRVIREIDPNTFDVDLSEKLILQYFCDIPADYAETYRNYLTMIEQAERRGV